MLQPQPIRKATPHDAVYEGNTVSPHIKPEYMQVRLRSQVLMQRKRSVGADQIPSVQGLAMKHPFKQRQAQAQQQQKQIDND